MPPKTVKGTHFSNKRALPSYFCPSPLFLVLVFVVNGLAFDCGPVQTLLHTPRGTKFKCGTVLLLQGHAGHRTCRNEKHATVERRPTRLPGKCRRSSSLYFRRIHTIELRVLRRDVHGLALALARDATAALLSTNRITRRCGIRARPTATPVVMAASSTRAMKVFCSVFAPSGLQAPDHGKHGDPCIGHAVSKKHADAWLPFAAELAIACHEKRRVGLGT